MKYKVMLQNSGGLWVEWPVNYKTEKAAIQASKHLQRKFKDSFWRTFYRNITPKVIKK